MNYATLADLGTAFVIYQAVYEILDDKSRYKLDRVRGNQFEKFSSQAEQIDALLVAQEPQVTANCEKFCEMALEGIFSMLDKHFPVTENESK